MESTFEDGPRSTADDYLGKPFDLTEVEARLRALVRRAQGADLRQLTNFPATQKGP